MNQAEDEQERVRLITAGKHNTPLLIHCSTILPIWTPPHLLSPPDDRQRTALQQWFNDRKKYQWVVVQTYRYGRIKFICPQSPSFWWIAPALAETLPPHSFPWTRTSRHVASRANPGGMESVEECPFVAEFAKYE